MNPSIVVAVLAVLIVLGLILLAFLGLIWYIFQRPLARLKGELELAGLDAPVEIVRDRWGVPHIYAQSRRDVYFAQGFVHAQDRLFQMDYGRRLAQGTLCEVFGPAALEADRWSRVLGFWRAVQQDWSQLQDEEREILQAYSAGVNAWIQAFGLRRPAEFAIMGIMPQPWTPQDSLGLLKVMGWALGQNWESELLRLQLLQALGPERALELEAFYPEAHPTILPLAEGAGFQALAEAVGRIQGAYEEASRWFGQMAVAGSNNWVVAGSRTATRQPLLANDPHLSVAMPTFWHENHLEERSGRLRVTGAALPGVPGIMIGHNQHIGWGITAGRADGQDLYVEQRHPQQATWFRFEDEWEPARVLREEISVRGLEEPHREEVVITRHGPLVNGLLAPDEAQEVPPLALRWTGQEPSRAFGGLLRVQAAEGWEAFRAAVAHVGEPSLNVIYADVAGNIGYQYVGRLPRRSPGQGLIPVPGWDGQHEWQGWLPFEELPSVLNPDVGYLLSANNKPASDDYPHYLGGDWYPGYRAERIRRMLQVKPRYTVRDFQRMQTDVYSVQAEALVPFMIIVDGETALERRIIRELEAWNLRVEVDSFAAAAYEVMRLHLLDLVFSDKLAGLEQAYKGKTHSTIFTASGFAGTAGLTLVMLLEQEESWWFHDAGSSQPRTREQLLRLALKRTAVTLHDLIGKDPRKWAWGKVHQVEFQHLLGRGRLLRTIFNRGQYPIGGDEHTVWMTAYDLGLPFGLVTTTATYRQVLDVGDWDRSTAILPTGQSGQPGSRHYGDHFDLWREGEQHPMLWSRQAVDQEAQTTLWLRPLAALPGSGEND